MFNIQEAILNQGQLKVAIPNIQSMSHEEYALARKNYLGASDSSILCGVNLYKTLDQLITEKNCKFLTKEEKEVGEKPIVKKGYDLEPIILNKAEIELGVNIFKPEDMFAFIDTDGLSVNYDGVTTISNTLIPVEAKLVSRYGEKYYNKSKTIEENKQVTMEVEGESLEQHIKRKALKIGIPAYYYTQVQQEIAGLNSPYGYLAAMFDETWTFKIYYIPKDEYVISKIKVKCEETIDKINRATK